MKEQISPGVRVVALVGLVAALALGGGTFVLGRSDATAAEPLPAQGMIAQADAVGAQLDARVNGAEAQPAAAKAPAKKAPAPKPKRKPPLVDANGLPMAISAALRRHEVVVVALYVPAASVDAVSVAEARAGAGDARVGFVAFNVLDEANGRALSEKLGHVVDAPAVLVFRGADRLVVQLEGFADRATVAQAAANALAASS